MLLCDEIILHVVMTEKRSGWCPLFNIDVMVLRMHRDDDWLLVQPLFIIVSCLYDSLNHSMSFLKFLCYCVMNSIDDSIVGLVSHYQSKNINKWKSNSPIQSLQQRQRKLTIAWLGETPALGKAFRKLGS